MARSRKKTPIQGIACSESDSAWKRRANRALRRQVRLAIADLPLDGHSDQDLPELREVSDIWDGDKDGKRYIHPSRPRFTSEDMDRAMRK